VLGQACQDAAKWQKLSTGGEPLPLHVNVSGRQFSQGDLAATLSRATAEAGVAPGSVLVELTETELMNDPRNAARKLWQLRESGVRLALDDFGTGYSSLFSLQQYPIDLLKVDMRFVAGLEQGRQGMRVVQAVVSLASGLGMGVVAEGVETEQQREQLLALGCTLGQGHLFALPLPMDELRVLTDGKNLRLRVELEGKGPLLVLGERRLVDTVFVNLLRNAAEASPEGEEILVRLRTEDGQAVATLHNKGAVPTDIRERFFEKYATSGKVHGTGLGTYSARLMVRAMNGGIELDTSEPDATTLVVRLPLAEQAAPAD